MIGQWFCSEQCELVKDSHLGRCCPRSKTALMNGEEMRASEDLLLDAVIEHFVLLRDHWEHPIKGKAILLWSRNGLRTAHHDSLKIVIE